VTVGRDVAGRPGRVAGRRRFSSEIDGAERAEHRHSDGSPPTCSPCSAVQCRFRSEQWAGAHELMIGRAGRPAGAGGKWTERAGTRGTQTRTCPSRPSSRHHNPYVLVLRVLCLHLHGPEQTTALLSSPPPFLLATASLSARSPGRGWSPCDVCRAP